MNRGHDPFIIAMIFSVISIGSAFGLKFLFMSFDYGYNWFLVTALIPFSFLMIGGIYLYKWDKIQKVKSVDRSES